jgi:hypothetical protein
MKSRNPKKNYSRLGCFYLVYYFIQEESMKIRKQSLSQAPVITITEPGVLLRIRQKFKEGLTPQELYNITRGEWVIGERRKQAKYAFAVYCGVVLEVYRIEKWLPFTGRTPSTRQRWCFKGQVAKNLRHYREGSVQHYFVRGEANPVKYINC